MQDKSISPHRVTFIQKELIIYYNQQRAKERIGNSNFNFFLYQKLTRGKKAKKREFIIRFVILEGNREKMSSNKQQEQI